jgi:hypothetical protein
MDIRKKYLAALKGVSLGIFTGPWKTGFWRDLGEALGGAVWHLFVLLTWLISVATYPVSVFFVAGLVVYSDAVSARAHRKADEEWMKGMDRGIDGDE